MSLDAVASPSSWCCQWVSESDDDDDDDDDVDHRQVHTVRAKLPETWKSGFLDRSNIFYCSICFSRIPTFDIFLSWKRIDWNSNQTIPSCIYKLPLMPASVQCSGVNTITKCEKQMQSMFYNNGFPHVLLWHQIWKVTKKRKIFAIKHILPELGSWIYWMCLQIQSQTFEVTAWKTRTAVHLGFPPWMPVATCPPFFVLTHHFLSPFLFLSLFISLFFFSKISLFVFSPLVFLPISGPETQVSLLAAHRVPFAPFFIPARLSRRPPRAHAPQAGSHCISRTPAQIVRYCPSFQRYRQTLAHLSWPSIVERRQGIDTIWKHFWVERNWVQISWNHSLFGLCAAVGCH